ncbi:MAG: cob(I)yrinic acid a,c-diamide adenosyltransferase [Balneolaceae bacterium]|nr:cob(I)yrinic acid a,c-diamide adenosyltransferase [Balneolaceae bacterium]
MKIYTKRGDKGDTSLYGGARVSKSSARIKAYGTVDELNSWLGLALEYTRSEKAKNVLEEIQKHLFILGADLATPPDAKTRISRIEETHVVFLENAIDEMSEELPELKNFILPGGAESGSRLHVARTICRRAERAVVECSNHEQVSDVALKYLNRLSDLLFVAARFENKNAGTPETTWKPERNDNQ